jgi:hypothetical protein
MEGISATAERPASPLETFVGTYLDTLGGAWDEVEPQVYDVLLPANGAGTGLTRITFDPEALPEHPGAQLASFGTPFIDGLLNDALQRGRWGRFYLVGVNLAPHDLASRVRRATTLPPPLELHLERVRALHFAQAVFWFEAAFVSDQKEQELLPVAMDLHYGREVRHREALLERSRLAEQPSVPLPEARRLSMPAVYPMARDQVLRSLSTLASTRSRDLTERVERQIARMAQYYADLRSELEDQRRRTRRKDDAGERLDVRRAAIDREEKLRIAELRQKSTLRVHLRLLQLLEIQQPKLLVQVQLTAPDRTPGRLELVWDPLLEALEAAPCPECGRPTYAFDLTRQGRVVCPACAARAVADSARKTSR